MDPLGAATRNPFSLAERLLGIVTGALDNNQPYSRSAPERRYVAHGTPVLDLLDQLTVHLSNIRLSSDFEGGGSAALQGPKMVLADLTVTLVRNYPTGVVQLQGGKVKALPEEILSEASDQLYADGWTAYSAVWVDWTVDSPCSVYSLSPLLPLDPESGAAGWQFTLTTDIPQFCEAL